MTSEEQPNLKTEPQPLDAKGNLGLSLKLLAGALILGLLFWYLDSHLAN